VGNNLPSVSGTIESTDLVATSGTIEQRGERGGPRYPRAHLQRIAIEPRARTRG
jgi:hypothetical protein